MEHINTSRGNAILQINVSIVIGCRKCGALNTSWPIAWMGSSPARMDAWIGCLWTRTTACGSSLNMPIPCLITFKARPKPPRAIPKPRTIVFGPQNLLCSDQELAARTARKDAAQEALSAWGPCSCPKFIAHTRIALLQAYVAARLLVMACYDPMGDANHWGEVDRLEQSAVNCMWTARECPY